MQLRAIVASGAFAVLAFHVAAQTAPAASARPATTEDPVQLSAFEVTTTQDIGYQSTNAAEVTRMNTAIADIPMNVTVLNQQFIEDTMARTTEDVLEYVPGFVPTSNNDAWTVRGFANANTKFLNGFLQQESIGTVSVANVERVEVLKGPAAVLFGQGGFAAVLARIMGRRYVGFVDADNHFPGAVNEYVREYAAESVVRDGRILLQRLARHKDPGALELRPLPHDHGV